MLREELRICASEYAPCVSFKVQGGNLLPNLSSNCSVGGKGDLDCFGECCYHRVGCRVRYRYDEVGGLRGSVLLRVGEDVGAVYCLFEGRGGPYVCGLEFTDRR